MGSVRPKNMAIQAKREFVSVSLPALIANGTRSASLLFVPEHPAGTGKDRYVLKRVCITTTTAYSSAAGTILLNVIKRRGTSTDTTLVSNFDLESVAALAGATASFATGVTLADRTLRGGDRLRATIVSNNADATGPAAAEAVLTLELEPISLLSDSAADADGNVEAM